MEFAMPRRRILSVSTDPVEQVLSDAVLLERVFFLGANKVGCFSAETRAVILAAVQKEKQAEQNPPDDLSDFPETWDDLPFLQLRPRQQEILRLIAQGRTSKEIANLYPDFKPKKIDNMVWKLTHKYGFRSRTELVHHFAAAIERAEKRDLVEKLILERQSDK
jgi:DNA-binding NarL/FixJ family response regulator